MISGLTLSIIQSLIFVPDDFIMWTVGDSVPMLTLFLFTILCYYFFIIRKARKDAAESNEFLKIGNFIKKYRKNIIATFLGVIVITGYYMITNVSIISSDKIVTHSFFYPQGKEYSYSDISAIHTGVYSSSIPFVRFKGDFYYKLEFNTDKKINLANVSGVKDFEDSWLTIMELDQIFTEFAETKNVDTKHSDKFLMGLGKLYRDRVINVFENVK